MCEKTARMDRWRSDWVTGRPTLIYKTKNNYMKEAAKVIIRSPLPGEYGWIIKIHGEYYADKFGWDEEFECIVAKIMVDFISKIPSIEQACFIAELNNKPVGCVILMKKSEGEGQVRVLFVLEEARGKRVGSSLIDALLIKAQEIGYKSLNLWTTNNQVEARDLYKKTGFSCISVTPNTTFAKGSYDEEWKMTI